jgi:glycerol kinase
MSRRNNAATSVILALDHGTTSSRVIGISNQGETALVWDRASGEPAANAIVWQDRRAAGLCDALRGRSSR